jgi:hypothetical protein
MGVGILRGQTNLYDDGWACTDIMGSYFFEHWVAHIEALTDTRI